MTSYVGYSVVGAADATGPNAYSLDCQPGSIAITGAAATLPRGLFVDAQPGSYAVTGTAATLARGYQIDAQPGGYTITGSDAALLAARLVDAQPGAIAITGTAATLARGLYIDAQPGAYTVTGFVATTARGLYLDAQPGSHAITGVDATLLKEGSLNNYTIDAQPGAIAVTGAATTLERGFSISAEPGAFTISAGAGEPTVTLLTASFDTGNANNDWDTASISVAPGDTIVVDIAINGYSGGNLLPDSVSGAGLTFALVGSTSDYNTWSRQSRWRAQATASGSGAITISLPAGGAWDLLQWAVVKFTGLTLGNNGADAFVQTVINQTGTNGSTYSVTLASLANANNLCLAQFVGSRWSSSTTATASPGDSATELWDQTPDGGSGFYEWFSGFYKAGLTDPDVTWTASTTEGRSGIASELSVAAGGATLALSRAVLADSGSIAVTGSVADLVYAAGATAYSLDCQPGAYTITGTAATLARGLYVDAQPGAATITGTAATLARGLYADAQPGSYAITGFATTVVADRVINAQPGAFTITGAQALLARGLYLDCQPGAYAISGFDADLVKTSAGQYLIDAQPGAFTITGTDASVVAGRVLDASAGSIAVTGVAATLVYGRFISADPGSVAIAGTAATLARGLFISADPGAVAITGSPTELGYGRFISADAGAVTVAGTDAGVVAARVVNAAAGSVAISGVDAGLVQSATDRYINAEPGSVVITGFAAYRSIIYVAPQQYAINAEPGSYTIRSVDVTLEGPRPLWDTSQGMAGRNLQKNVPFRSWEETEEALADADMRDITDILHILSSSGAAWR